MSETKEKTTETYAINCRFEIQATFEVVAEDLDAAIKKLDRPLLSEYGLSDSTFGFDEYALEAMGIKLCKKSVEAFDSPSPTGRQYTSRDWEYEVIEEAE
jgi:hypothetical protein